MKKVITLAAALLIGTTAMSTSVMAATQYKDVTTNQTAQYVTDAVSSQAEAEALAANFVSNLEQKDNFELSQQLPTPHLRMDKRSMEVTDTELSVVTEEAQDGSIEYRAVVDVDYSYNYRSDKG
jgi:alpha-acetolactate decarboxylase